MTNGTTNNNSATIVWKDLVNEICRHGSESKPRGLRIREILGKQTKIDMKNPVLTLGSRALGYRFLAAEAWWIITGHNDVASIRPYSRHIAAFSDDGRYFDGSYGVKIVDQLRYIVDTLSKDQDSRQAVLEIWRPNPRDSRDIPCTISAQWMIRRGECDCVGTNGGHDLACSSYKRFLHCFDTMRSSDAWLGWPYDVFNFSMLSAYILLMLREREQMTGSRLSFDKSFFGVDLGNLTLTAASQHLYVDPAADGNTNIPYTLTRAVSAITDTVEFQIRGLDIDEFDSPDSLIECLSAVKDREPTKYRWLSELQPSTPRKVA